MRNTSSAIGGLVLLLVASTVGSWAVLSVRAQERRQIFVSVMESNGVPVLDLKASEVKVFEDRVAGRTLSVEPIEWPMKLTVMVDNGTRASDYLSELRTGLRNFYNEIPDEVELSLLTLAPQPRWITRPTTDLNKQIKDVDLIAPDGAAGKFFDGLSEAAGRVEKAKGDYFPVFVLVTSDIGNGDPPLEREWERLKKRVTDHAITVHFVMITTGSYQNNGVTGSMQTHIGLALTEMSGGRYEHINSFSRLATLLPEIGQQIAKSHFKQTHQYRVTYEPPPGAATGQKDVSVSISTHGPATITPTRDGRLP